MNMKKIFSLLSLMLGITIVSFAQKKEIRGTVTDAAGVAIAKATIIEKGTKNNAVANENGEFVIRVDQGAKSVTLEVSSTGYEAKKVTTDGKTLVIVKLEKKVVDESAVVVVSYGYFSQKKADKTGTITSISSKDLKDNTLNNAAEAINGKIAGVSATVSDGAPDAEVSITVRNGTSLTQSNKPLTVVDGIIIEDGLSAVAPQDIETIDVLKDASATALFGARGSNGVIVITTKSGKSGKFTVNYNGSIGYREFYNELEVLDPYDYAVAQYERAIANNELTSFQNKFYSTFDSLKYYKDSAKIDWQKEVFGRKALTSTHNISIAGGSKNTTYAASLTSSKDEGVLMGTEIDRKIFSVKIDQKVTEKLKVGLNSRFNSQVINGPKIAEGDETQSSNKLRHAIRYVPMLLGGSSLEEFDPDLAEGSTALINPIVVNRSEYRKIIRTFLNLTGTMSYKFNKQFSFKSTAGIDQRNISENQFYSKYSNKALVDEGGYIATSTPIAVKDNTIRRTFSNSNILTFTPQLTKKNSFTAILGHEIYDFLEESNVVSRGKFPDYFTANQALSQMSAGEPYRNGKNDISNSDRIEKRILSFFGKVDYNYDSKYYFALSFRADGSSIFAPGKRWGYFPSGSAAWRIAKEKFMEKISDKIKLSELKLRLSYGATGNNNVPAYYYLDQWVVQTQSPTVSVIKKRYLPNANLKWETTYAKNIGLDLGFIKDRITLSIDAFENVTKDLLIQQPVPSSAGTIDPYRYENVGQTSSRGIEIQLGGTLVKQSHFTWSANFNIAFAKRRMDVFKVSGNTSKLYYSNWSSSAGKEDFIVEQGKEIGLMYGFVTDGFYKASDFNPTYNSQNGQYIYSKDNIKSGVVINDVIGKTEVGPGSIKFKDLNGDGHITEEDRTVIGNAFPKYTGGLTQQFTLYGFDASVFVNWSVGSNVYNANNIEFTNGATKNGNYIAIMKDRWRTVDEFGQDMSTAAPAVYDELNKNAKIWKPEYKSNFLMHSWAIEDASFLRINNVTIGYTFSSKWLTRKKITKLRIYMTGTNLAVITGYSGYDPEVNTRTQTPLTPGVDYSAYPKSKMYTFGINLGL